MEIEGILTPRFYPLTPHPVQLDLIQSPARFKVVPAGRRSGKSERAKRNLVLEALSSIGGRWDNPKFFAAAPTRDQAKSIYWEDIKAMVPPNLITEVRESSLTLEILGCCEIRVIGMDKPQRIEGTPWNGGILDEYADMKKQAWGAHVRPALADRQGWCWLIGVPEGRNHYYNTYDYALNSGDPEWAAFTWKSADILPESEIESARRTLDELTFRQEYEASFETFTGRAYYKFEKGTHCARLEYNPRGRLAFCFDFNVSPGVCAVVQELPLPSGLTGSAVIGEVYIPRNSTTEAVCNKLISDWGDHQGGIFLYGDATGGAQGSAKVAGSDWDIIKRMMRAKFGEKRVFFKVPKANPRERARVNAMNTRLMNGAGEVKLMIDPNKAPHVVTDLEGVRVLEGGSGELDKKVDPDLTHISDALGYYVEKEYPINNKEMKVAEMDGF